MCQATVRTGIVLVRPLWQIPRHELANEGFQIVVSCANIDKMGQSIAKDSVGKSYYDVYEKLKEINGIV